MSEPAVLVCPACKTRSSERIDVRTLDRVGDVMACACGRRYPIIDGVPIVIAEPEAVYRDAILQLIERDLPPPVAALLAAAGPDAAPYPALVEHLAIYLDAHWGDRATPAPDGPAEPFALAHVAARIAARAAEHVELAVELGCNAGRVVAELAAGADHVVGLDLHFPAVRRARRLLAGEALPYLRRTIGRHYAPVVARGLAVPHATLVCGDALDPPLVPRAFGRVVALNLLDSVRSPAQLLSVVDGLCARGGEVILASPYAWQGAITDPSEQLGGADPAAHLVDRLRRGADLEAPYAIEDEAELPWTLRRDSRSAATYRIHYVRARKM